MSTTPAAIAAQAPIDPCTPETIAKWGLVGSGGLQALGVVLGAFGLPARAEIVSADRGVAKGEAKSFTLAVVPAGGGAAFVGTF